MLSLQEMAIWNSNGNEELQIKQGGGGSGGRYVESETVHQKRQQACIQIILHCYISNFCLLLQS